MKIRNLNLGNSGYRIYLIFFSLFILLFSCTKKSTVSIIVSPGQEFSQAMDLLQAKKYNKAIESFQNIVFNYPGSSYAADAQFYLADAYFQKKDYNSAIPEFEFFVNSFTGNQHIEEAYYKTALSYFYVTPAVGKDQVVLGKTLEIIDELKERFPETKYREDIEQLKNKIAERWSEKSYIIGELYFKGGEYASACVYLDFVQNEFPQTKWSSYSKYLLGQIYEKTDSIAQAISLYQTLQNDSTDVNIRKLVKQRLDNLKQK